MTENQIKQAQEAVRILTVVAGIACLNGTDRDNTNGAISFLNQQLAQELRAQAAQVSKIVDAIEVIEPLGA